jgi:hypothetical protein
MRAGARHEAVEIHQILTNRAFKGAVATLVARHNVMHIQSHDADAVSLVTCCFGVFPVVCLAEERAVLATSALLCSSSSSRMMPSVENKM